MKKTDPKKQIVYYIRHKHDQCIIDELEAQNRIAIFYDNCNELQDKKEILDTFKGSRAYKTAIEYFWKLRDEGGLVAVKYQDEPQIIIGKISAGTKIEIIPNPAYNPEAKPNMDWRSEKDIQMTLKYEPVRTLKYTDFPLLSAVQPRYVTICVPSAEFFQKIIPEIVDGIEIKPTRQLLHHKVLEQLCVEYLYKIGVKDGDKLDYCILRPGGEAASIDIAGIMCSSKKLFAQVKADNINPKALNSFKDFVKDTKNSINIIFSADEELTNAGENILHINVDKVFDDFLQDKPAMIYNMIGIKGT